MDSEPRRRNNRFFFFNCQTITISGLSIFVLLQTLSEFDCVSDITSCKQLSTRGIDEYKVYIFYLPINIKTHFNLSHQIYTWHAWLADMLVGIITRMHAVYHEQEFLFLFPKNNKMINTAAGPVPPYLSASCSIQHYVDFFR